MSNWVDYELARIIPTQVPLLRHRSQAQPPSQSRLGLAALAAGLVGGTMPD
jgi:hypothetical protein